MEKNSFLTHIRALTVGGGMYPLMVLVCADQTLAEQVADEVLRGLICPNHSAPSDQCHVCQRFVRHTLLNMMYVGDGNLAITKEQIEQLTEQFQRSQLGGELLPTKGFVIKNGENLKVEAANSLLKFLEELNDNTFGVIISRNKGGLLPTISSRAQVFILDSDESFTPLNPMETILTQRAADAYLLAADNFKKLPREELIALVETAYNRTVLHNYPAFIEATLELLEDLKFRPNPNLALERYFICLAELSLEPA